MSFCNSIVFNITVINRECNVAVSVKVIVISCIVTDNYIGSCVIYVNSTAVCGGRNTHKVSITAAAVSNCQRTSVIGDSS